MSQGMDTVFPEVVLSEEDRLKKKASKPLSFLPKTGKDIQMFIGKPLNFTEKIQNFKKKYPEGLKPWYSTLESLKLYREITSDIEKELLRLEQESRLL